MDLRTLAQWVPGIHFLSEVKAQGKCILPGHPADDTDSLLLKQNGEKVTIGCYAGLGHTTDAILSAWHLSRQDLIVSHPAPPDSPAFERKRPEEAFSGNGSSSNGSGPKKAASTSSRFLPPMDVWKLRVAKVVEADCEQIGNLTWQNTKPEALIDSATLGALDIIRQSGLLPPEQSDIELEVRNIATGVIQGYLDRYEAGSLTILSVDPILQAVDRALTNIVQKDSIEFETTDNYLTRVREARGRTKVLVEGVARSHSLGMLVGRAWQGKTTLAANKCRAMLLGEKFLGYQCYPSRVGYMALERNGEDVAALFEKWGIHDQVKFVDSVPMGDPREMARALAFAVRKYELEAVTVDHLIGMIRMMDGNDYVGVSMALAPFNAITKITGVYLLLLHHQPKGTSTGTEINVMGSEAFRAATDTLMEASKIGNNYFFRAQLRGCADIERVRVKLLDQGLVGGDESVEGVKAEVLEALQGFDKEVSKDALVDKYPALATFHAKTILRALKELYDDQKIDRDKKRGRWVYWVLGDGQEQKGHTGTLV